MRDTLAIVLLCLLALLPIAAGLAEHLQIRVRRQRRLARRHLNLGYQSAWAWVFGRSRHRRLTDQRAPEEH